MFSKYYDYHKILDPWYFRGEHYYVTTANAIFRRAPFDAVGGFDADVAGAGGEDPGLCFKLQNAGYGLGYNPDAVIHHQYTPTLRAFMRTFFRYGYGCAGQSRRHYRHRPFVQSSAFGALDVHND
jgi:cellulose synthase/poly-beta-1,6-N-acetylglucosamine synthase-like glycosyltransferase